MGSTPLLNTLQKPTTSFLSKAFHVSLTEDLRDSILMGVEDGWLKVEALNNIHKPVPGNSPRDHPLP